MKYKDGLNIDVYGTKRWYLNGQQHRTDGPAEEFANGDKLWWLNGKLHRDGGPAIDANGYKAWYLNGQQLTEAEIRTVQLQKIMEKF